MQRTMLAAVHATEERLIPFWCLMRISAHLAFSYTTYLLLALQNTCHRILDASQSESDLH